MDTAPYIDEQVQAIRRATELATKSSAAAIKFLVDAGIMKAGNYAMVDNRNSQSGEASQNQPAKKQ